MTVCRKTLGIVLAMMSWSVAHAQAPDGKMQTFIASKFYKGLVNRAIAAVPASIFQRCPKLQSTGSNIRMLQPMTFAPDGYPIAGAWKQEFPVGGCGNDTVLNFYYRATPDEKVDTLIGLPGTTLGDLTLQRDARTYVNAALIARGCSNADVKNTHFEGFGAPNPMIADPGPGEKARPWWETWTMVGCGRTFEVPVDFVPGEKSMQIIQPAHVIER